MRRIVIINNSRVWVDGAQEYTTLEGLLAAPPGGSLLIGVIPAEVGRVLATARTLDAAMTQQYPGENSYSTHPIDANVHQVYVAPDSMLGRLRSLSRDVRLVPYPAAVMATVLKNRPQRGLIERTQVFLGTKPSDGQAESAERELLAVDMIDDDYLMTAIRGREVVAVRHAQGDVVTEIQRTLASARMDAPTLLCQDQQLALELQAQGFKAELLRANGPLIGAAALPKIETARFLNQFEVAQKRRAELRRQALLVTVVALGLFLLAAGAWAFFEARSALEASKARELEAAKQAQVEALGALYADRYGSVARAQSLQIRNEVFDLLTVLPPQVVMMSVKKDATGTLAVVERRTQAAPFDTADLRSALRASGYFAGAQITEEYEGHLIRYLLKVPPPTQVPPAAAP